MYYLSPLNSKSEKERSLKSTISYVISKRRKMKKITSIKSHFALLVGKYTGPKQWGFLRTLDIELPYDPTVK